MNAVKRNAHFAGVLYFLLGVTAPIGLLIVPGRVIVPGNAAATAENLRASESLFRIGIASELVHQTICVFLVLALFRLFKPVSETLSWQLVILGALLSVPIMFVNVLNDLAALILVSDAGFLSVFDRPQLDALAFLFVRLHGLGITVASIFWGLWLFPFGLLVIRSGFIPRIFGYLLFVAGAAYLVDSFVTIVMPHYAHAVGSYTGILEIAEVPIIFWLLIGGARVKPGTPAAALA